MGIPHPCVMILFGISPPPYKTSSATNALECSSRQCYSTCMADAYRCLALQYSACSFVVGLQRAHCAPIFLFSLGHVDDLLPFFLSYAKRLYPVLDCLEDLREISDFRGPADL